MDEGGGSDPPPVILESHALQEIDEFRKLVVTDGKKSMSSRQHKFLKKLAEIPLVALPMVRSCKTAINLAEKGLIG